MTRYSRKFDTHEYPGVSKRGLAWLAKNGFKQDKEPVIGYMRSWRRLDKAGRRHAYREMVVVEGPTGEIGFTVTLVLGSGRSRCYVALSREDGPSTVQTQYCRLLKLADGILQAMWFGADIGAIAENIRTGVYNGEEGKDAVVRQQG